PPPEGPARVRVTVTYPGGSVTGSAADAAVRVGGQAAKLSELRDVRWRPAPGAVRHDGKALAGPLTGLEALEVTLGKEKVRLSLDDAVSARFEAPRPAEAVAYVLVARQGGKEVARLTG